MASRGFFDFAADRSSPVSSYGSDSQVFHSPRSLSPQDDIIHRENTEASEILVTHENHYGTCTPPAAANQDERSMSLHFIGSSSSFELEQVSVWRRIRYKGGLNFIWYNAVRFSWKISLHVSVKSKNAHPPPRAYPGHLTRGRLRMVENLM